MTTSNKHVMSPMDYVPDLSLLARLNRRRVFWKKTAPIHAPTQSIITFSFDDFPKSAADTGAEIVESIGAKAIYYACSGLAGCVNRTGEQYVDTDMLALDRAGHEIGAHTHTHLDCSRASTDAVMRDISENLDQLKQMGLTKSVDHFAYPYGETTTELKTALKDKFLTARGIRTGINAKGADRMQLTAVELKPDTATTAQALAAIERANTTPAWLHIFTHDITANPSPFGTTPQELKKIVKKARDSGIRVATPREAMPLYGASFDI
ncbi:MAG: polysaccharide deacetylase family protein [Hyphomonadaceae bacterium]